MSAGGYASARYGRAGSALLALLALVAWGAQPVAADAGAGRELRPPPLRAVALEERTGERLPLDLRFEDSAGHAVTLADYFRSGRPVLLTMAYIECPMLCSLVVRGVAQAVRRMSLAAGDDYQLVTVAIDPRERRDEAAAKERSLRVEIGREPEDGAWVYLRGDEQSVRRLAAALGFGYAWDPRTEQYAHPAAAFVVAADGRIARYFHGARFDAAALQEALDAASRGETSASLARSVLACFRFDPALRAQRERIQHYFRIGAGGLLLSLCGLIGGLVLWRWRKG